MLRYMSFREAAVLYALACSAIALHLPRQATVISRQDANCTEYGFVIAGGGLSSLTVADRLTEDPNGISP
jgi:hypothetical protein